MTRQQGQSETKQTTIKPIQWLTRVTFKILIWHFYGDTGFILAPL